MEDKEGNITGQSNSQSLPNNTTTRSVERTATQRLPIPILEKNDHTSAKLWWRKFVQYIKMTREIDLSKMTNSKEILPQFRDQLEEEIKDVFIWAIGQSAITEMTKTVREREPNFLPLYRLYTLFRLHFIPERNKHHSRADFFQSKTRTRRISCGNVETHSRNRKELRIRRNNGSRITGIKIFIRNWKNNRRQ